jgi:hypothetical protein
MFGFAHNGHGALANERDGHRMGAHAVATRRRRRRGETLARAPVQSPAEALVRLVALG